MDKTKWEASKGHYRPKRDRPTVPQVLPLVAAYLQEVKGRHDPLHCAMADGNLHPAFFALKESDAQEYPATAALARTMLQLSKTQRRKVYASA